MEKRISHEINIEEFNEIKENTILLDVRSPQEYKEGHLERGNKYSIIRIR